MAEKGMKIKPNIENKEILNGINAQIGSFDSKAGILISVVSILLALSLSLIDVLTIITKDKIIPFSIVYLLFLLSAIITIAFSILVVIPRSTPKELKGKENHVTYYKELATMKYDDYKSNKVEFYNDEKVIFSQIKSNAIICKTKHKYLRLAIYNLIPLAIFTIVMVILAISFIYFAK